MKSSLYRAKEMPDASGFFQVGVDDSGMLLLHAAPGQPPLDGMEVIVDGAKTEWSWQDLKKIAPEVAAKTLLVAFERPATKTSDAEVVSAIAEDVPGSAVIIEKDQPPHKWWGDE